MPESGHTWRREFKAHPAEADSVRRWVACRLEHTDAPQVANELFISVLSTGSPVVEMTLSTAGSRARMTAAGSVEMSALQSYGPGFRIISGLSALSGVNTDGQGLWAQLTSKTQGTEQ
ncbi:hypothetical protein [Streptomyces avermitilis]|uniref:hypothetical protein n=1 Tax=Streptomyces avermitilis TaxID=33903 RepID=UPI0033B72DDA